MEESEHGRTIGLFSLVIIEVTLIVTFV